MVLTTIKLLGTGNDEQISFWSYMSSHAYIQRGEDQDEQGWHLKEVAKFDGIFYILVYCIPPSDNRSFWGLLK